MNRNKKLNIIKMIIVFAVLGIALIISRFSEHKMIYNANTLEISRIVYCGNDVTNEMNGAKLKEELIKLRVRRSLAVMKSYRQEDYLIEIDANADGKPLHILIGNESLCYEGTGKVIKRILGGEKILNSWSSLYAVDQY